MTIPEARKIALLMEKRDNLNRVIHSLKELPLGKINSFSLTLNYGGTKNRTLDVPREVAGHFVNDFLKSYYISALDRTEDIIIKTELK